MILDHRYGGSCPSPYLPASQARFRLCTSLYEQVKTKELNGMKNVDNEKKTNVAQQAPLEK